MEMDLLLDPRIVLLKLLDNPLLTWWWLRTVATFSTPLKFNDDGFNLRNLNFEVRENPCDLHIAVSVFACVSIGAS